MFVFKSCEFVYFLEKTVLLCNVMCSKGEHVAAITVQSIVEVIYQNYNI